MAHAIHLNCPACTNTVEVFAAEAKRNLLGTFKTRVTCLECGASWSENTKDIHAKESPCPK